MGKKRQLVKNAGATMAQALRLMKSRADRAEADGFHGEAADIRKSATVLKLQIAERHRAQDPGEMGRRYYGLGVPLVENRHALPDDRDIRGI